MPLVHKLTQAYKHWHEILPHIPKRARYTLGQKIDASFLETIELVFTAAYLSKPQKRPYVQKATGKLDILKLFLRLSWEIKVLDTKKYATISERIDEIGRMLGGWNKQLSA